MRQIRHPLVRRDVMGIFDHILETTQGDLAAAERRLDEIDALLEAIADNHASGVRLDGRLAGWLARHGGRGRMITVVFRSDVEARLISPLSPSAGATGSTRPQVGAAFRAESLPMKAAGMMWTKRVGIGA